jgi:HEAT repeat protein
VFVPASGNPRICTLALTLTLILFAPGRARAQETTPPQEQTPPAQSTTPPQPETSHPGQKTEPSQEHQPKPEAQESNPAKRPRSTDSTREAWTILEEAATGEKAGERAAAIRSLGLLPGNKRAIRMAEKALKDDKPEVRTAAALALGDMQAKSTIPALKAATNDPEPSVALAAGQALSLLHDPAAYDVYFEVLTGERKTGKGLIASQKSMLRDPKKLASIGIAEGIGFIPFGGLGWEAIKALTKDDASPIRASAAKVLASDPDPASTKALENAAGDKSWLVRAAALEALAKRGDPSALSTVDLYTYDEKDVVKYTAAAAYLRLAEIKEKPTVNKRRPRAKGLRKK